MPVEHIEPAEKPNARISAAAQQGRVLYHWHGGEMTRRAKGLMEIYDRPLVELNPEDASQHGIQNGDCVLVTSRRGKI